MKKHTRRSILGILSMLPISSVAFASDFSARLGGGNMPDGDFDYEGEMMRRLDEGTLGDKYYDFLNRHKVEPQDLAAPKFLKHRVRLTKEFVSDIHNPKMDQLVAATLSAIPPN